MDDKEYVLRKMVEHFAQRRKDHSRVDAATLTRRRDNLDKRRDGYYELATDGDITKDRIRGKVAKIEEELEQVERELERTRNRDEELRRLDEAERKMRERIEANENNLHDGTPEKRHGLYQDLHLRVDVGEDGRPCISGVFPTRVAGITGTLLRTPEQRGYLYTQERLPLAERSYVRKKDTPPSRTADIIRGMRAANYLPDVQQVLDERGEPASRLKQAYLALTRTLVRDW